MFPRLHTKDLPIFNKGITNWPKKSNTKFHKQNNKQKKASSRKNNPKIIFLKFGYFLCSDYKSYLNFIKKKNPRNKKQTKSKWERKKRH